jgi:O-antigen/teichoic acid export membrane protein
MINSSKQYLKNFLILFSGNTVAQIIPFILAPFVARLFSPEEIAVQENFLALASLFAIAAAGRYEFAFLIPKEEKPARQLLLLSLYIAVCVSLLSGITLFFSEDIAKMYKTPELEPLIILVSPAVFLLSLLSIFNQWMIRKGSYPMITTARIMQSFVQNGGYIVLGYAGFGILGLLLGWLIGVLIPVVTMAVFSRKDLNRSDFHSQEISSLAKEHKDFPTINSLHAFTDILATQFLLYWIITRNYGAAALGFFALMSRYVRAPLNLVGSAIGQLYFREAGISSGNREKEIAVFYRSIKLMAAFSIPAMFVIVFFGPDIFRIYLGEKWTYAGEMARYMAPALLFNILSGVVSGTAILKQRQKQAYVISLIGYLLSLLMFAAGSWFNLSLNFTLICYSIVLSIYYLVLLYWYRKLILEPAA